MLKRQKSRHHIEQRPAIRTSPSHSQKAKKTIDADACIEDFLKTLGLVSYRVRHKDRGDVVKSEALKIPDFLTIDGYPANSVSGGRPRDGIKSQSAGGRTIGSPAFLTRWTAAE